MKKKVGAPPKPTKKNANEIALNYYETCKENKEMPFAEEVCILLDITRETLSEWVKTDKPLSDTIKKIANLQSISLQRQGFSRKGTPVMEIFLLKANHNMIETERKEITGKDGEGLEIKITNEAPSESNE